MRTQTHKTRNVMLTGCMLICITAGWILGSITTDVFSQSTRKSNNNDSRNTILLPSTYINGESIPTIFLGEITITAY